MPSRVCISQPNDGEFTSLSFTARGNARPRSGNVTGNLMFATGTPITPNPPPQPVGSSGQWSLTYSGVPANSTLRLTVTHDSGAVDAVVFPTSATATPAPHGPHKRRRPAKAKPTKAKKESAKGGRRAKRS